MSDYQYSGLVDSAARLVELEGEWLIYDTIKSINNICYLEYNEKVRSSCYNLLFFDNRPGLSLPTLLYNNPISTSGQIRNVNDLRRLCTVQAAY